MRPTRLQHGMPNHERAVEGPTGGVSRERMPCLHIHVLAAPTEVGLWDDQVLLRDAFGGELLLLDPLVAITTKKSKEGDSTGAFITGSRTSDGLEAKSSATITATDGARLEE